MRHNRAARRRALETLEDRRLLAVGVGLVEGIDVAEVAEPLGTLAGEPPFDLKLSNGSIPENSAGGSVVGQLSAQDTAPSHTGLALLYNPVDGSTRLKNFGPDEIRTDAYQIVSAGGKLDPVGWRSVDDWAATPEGFAEAFAVLGPGDDTVVLGWDEGGPSSTFLSEINLADEAVLSPAESWPIGKPFASFDPGDLVFEYRDVGATGGVVKTGQVLLDLPNGLSYSLVDADGGLFQIVGSELQVAPGANLNYESSPIHTVRVRVTDSGGLSAEQDFEVTLTNINEAPVVIVPPVQFSSPGGVLPLSGISVSDPDLLGADLDTKPVRLNLMADHGAVHFDSLAGVTIVGGANDSPSLVVEGPLTKLNAALVTLAHKSDEGFSGLAMLKVAVDDLGHAGEGAPLSDSKTVAIHVDSPPTAQGDAYDVDFGRTLRAQSYRQAVLSSEPAAYWRLGDNGTTAADSAGDLDGTASTGTLLGFPGALMGDADTAASFHDLNARILVDDAAALAGPTGPFSVEAWINPSEAMAWQRIVSTRNGPAGGWGFALSNGRLAFTTFGFKDYFIEGHPVPLNQWSHVAVVFDAGQDASFYLNGLFVGKIDGTANPNPGGSRLAIGDNPDQSAQPWLGELDEVAVYSHELTAAEIGRHYQAGLTNATVLANDTDAEGDPLTAILVAQPLHGALQFSPDGSFTYKPNAGFYGRDSFTYRAVDGFFESELAEVLLDVLPVPGDADSDGDVDLADFGLLKANFGTGTTREQADFNGDGKVDLADFGILKRTFGTVEPIE